MSGKTCGRCGNGSRFGSDRDRCLCAVSFGLGMSLSCVCPAGFTLFLAAVIMAALGISLLRR